MESRKRSVSDMSSYPISIEWIIKSENFKNAKEELLCSKAQVIPLNPNFEYYIQLHSNRTVNKDGEVGCYFFLKMKEIIDVNADVTIKCESVNYKSSWNHTFKKSIGYGGPLCSRSEFFDPNNKYVMDGQIVIKVTGILTFKSKEQQPKSKILKEKCLGSLLWENDEDKDVNIEIEKKQIKAHKYVLKRRSPGIANLLTIKDENNPNQNSNSNILKIDGFLFEIVENAIKFCYDLPVDDFLSDQDISDLLSFAHKYEITDLKKNTENVMIEKLTGSNVVTFANLSIFVKAAELYKKCFDFLVDSMKNSKAVADIGKLDSTIKEKLLERAFSSVLSS